MLKPSRLLAALAALAFVFAFTGSAIAGDSVQPPEKVIKPIVTDKATGAKTKAPKGLTTKMPTKQKAKKSAKKKTRGPKGVKRDDQGVSTSPISGFDTTDKLSPGGGIDVAF